jgi:hypothetical protein
MWALADFHARSPVHMEDTKCKTECETESRTECETKCEGLVESSLCSQYQMPYAMC